MRSRIKVPVIVLTFFSFFAFYRLGVAAPPTFITPFPELASCKTITNSLGLSYIEEVKGGFLLKPRINTCTGLGSTVSYLAPLNLADTKVTIASGGDILTQRINTAKALGLEALPVSGANGYYRYDTDFKEIKEKLGTGNYCLFIFDLTSDSFCINMYNSIKDDLTKSQTVRNNIIYSYQTASIGDYVTDGLALIFSPYYVSNMTYWYYGAEYYLRPRGLDISADFLGHALFSDPTDLEFDGESKVAEKIKEDEKFKKRLMEIKTRIGKGKLKFSAPVSIEFTSGDLFTSIGGALLDYNAIKTDEGYTVNITITDDYDFEFKGWAAYESNFFVTAMNNKALFDQYTGVIHNYSVTIEVQEFIPFNQTDDEKNKE
ncbi:MAG: hypothetical protein V1880_01110 [Patescibacteria group bacterium]